MEQVNVFGMPLHVGTRDELIQAARACNEPAYYPVSRCEDTPEHLIPLSIRGRMLRTPCEECGEICWYDSKNYIPFTTIVCMQCLAEITAQAQAQNADPSTPVLKGHASVEQIREVRQHIRDRILGQRTS